MFKTKKMPPFLPSLKQILENIDHFQGKISEL